MSDTNRGREINYKNIIHYETIKENMVKQSLLLASTAAALCKRAARKHTQDRFIANFYYREKLNQLLGLTFGIVYCFSPLFGTALTASWREPS